MVVVVKDEERSEGTYDSGGAEAFPFTLLPDGWLFSMLGCVSDEVR